MDDFTLGLMGLFTILAYLSTIIFFWAIFKENCAATNNPSIDISPTIKATETSQYPADPSFKNFFGMHGKSLAYSGIIFLGIFGFFITHVCDYQ
jgi:hypothetical protein